jgi:hypothetical protein
MASLIAPAACSSPHTIRRISSRRGEATAASTDAAVAHGE